MLDTLAIPETVLPPLVVSVTRYRHNVSRKHLHRYVSEFDFRYNYRTAAGYSDNDRTAMVLKEIAGKRLTYRRINAPA